MRTNKRRKEDDNEKTHAMTLALNRGIRFEQQQQFQEALIEFRLAAAAGHASAVTRVGLALLQGQGAAPDVHAAIHLFQQAAVMGDARAMNALGVCYGEGRGVEKDVVKALEWCHRAADAGYADALFNVAIVYERQRGADNEVVPLYRCAADATEPQPLFSLWDWFTPWRVKLQPTAAAVHAMYCLARCYANGTGVAKNAAIATHWYGRAAGAGHAGAMLQLAGRFASEHDWPKALEWCRRAAELGDVRAMNCLAWHYESGCAVEASVSTAIDWYRRAHDAGHPGAADRLAALTTSLALMRTRATEICVALDDLSLPALVTFEILDAALPNGVRMAAKWNVVAVKHFERVDPSK